MRRLLPFGFIIWLSGNLPAQDRMIEVTAFAGINSTRLNLTDPHFEPRKFTKGGYYFFGGLESELRLTNARINRFYLTVISGISFLSNGFSKTYTDAVFNTFTVDGYNYESTNMTMKYIQVPLVMRLKWRPFPLLEEFHVFAGAGVSGNVLLNAQLSEKAATSGFPTNEIGFVVMDFDLDSRVFPSYEYQPPSTKLYSDQADISDKRKQLTLFSRLEFGTTFERVTLAVRMSRALQDMYASGIQANWAVPQSNSLYLKSHASNRKIFEKYSEVVVGLRLF